MNNTLVILSSCIDQNDSVGHVSQTIYNMVVQYLMKPTKVSSI